MESRSNDTGGRQDGPGIARVTAEERYRSLVDAIKDYAIFLLDPEGHVASWNAGAERIKGYRANEIIGRHFSVFYPPEAVERGYPAEELARASKLGRWEDEGWRICKDGSRFWADVVINALYDEDGSVIGYAKVTRDLTERRNDEERLRQSEERLRLLMDAVEDAVVMLDPQGRITSWNAGATRLKGFEAGEIIGQHISRFYPMEEIAARRPERELSIAATHGRVEDEGWHLRKDGSRFWANVVITAIYGPTGELVGFAEVVRDMTERNRLRQLEYASELASRIEATREEEKRRIARELHDDLGQQLTALKMGLNSLYKDWGETSATSVPDALRDAVERAIASVRRVAAGRIRPRTPVIERTSLMAEDSPIAMMGGYPCWKRRSCLRMRRM
ncbi:PAS domain S-box protein [Paraburkholderia sp. A2RO-4L]